MVLVDSSVWIEALRRNGRLDIKLAVEGLLEADEAQWCSPVRLVVLGGAGPGECRRLEHHFSAVPFRACNEEDWYRATELAEKLLSVPWLDIVTASLALHDGIRIFATAGHFKKIPGLALYEPGRGGAFRPE